MAFLNMVFFMSHNMMCMLKKFSCCLSIFSGNSVPWWPVKEKIHRMRNHSYCLKTGMFESVPVHVTVTSLYHIKRKLLYDHNCVVWTEMKWHGLTWLLFILSIWPFMSLILPNICLHMKVFFSGADIWCIVFVWNMTWITAVRFVYLKDSSST